jgi:transcriptional regulator with XRE-family HTH domain
MDKRISERAQLFGEYVCGEIKGAIVSRGYSQADVASAIGRQSANLSRWLNAKPTIPIEVADEVCEFAGLDLADIVDRAQKRVIDELGEYGSTEAPTSGSDASREAEIRDMIANPEKYDLAANRDKYKEAEMNTPRD